MEDSFEGLKVMVIDDSKTIRRTAETLLQKAGCTVYTAVDGFDALAKIADSTFSQSRNANTINSRPSW